MSDHKKNLITTDEQKASSIAPETSLAPMGDSKKKIRKAPKVKKKPRKKGLPIAVDILIVVVLLAAIAGAVWGIYALNNYFSTRYAEKEITYTLLAENVSSALVYDEEGNCVVRPDSDVFVLEQEQSTPVGKVLSVSCEDNGDGTADVYVVVRTTANYNYTLGYFAGQTKIAVGKAYTYRFSGLVSEAVTVELQITEEEA